MAEVFAALLLIFRFWPSSRGKEWSKSLFHKYLNSSKNFQTLFLLASVLPLVRIGTPKLIESEIHFILV